MWNKKAVRTSILGSLTIAVIWFPGQSVGFDCARDWIAGSWKDSAEVLSSTINLHCRQDNEIPKAVYGDTWTGDLVQRFNDENNGDRTDFHPVIWFSIVFNASHLLQEIVQVNLIERPDIYHFLICESGEMEWSALKEAIQKSEIWNSIPLKRLTYVLHKITERRGIVDAFQMYSLGSSNYLAEVTLRVPLDIYELHQKNVNRHFHGMGLRMVAQPFNTINPSQLEVSYKDGNKSIELVSGFDYEVILYLQHLLNFSIHPILGSGFIASADNGSLLGLGGQLLRNEVDIAMTSSEFLPYRAEHLSFLFPTYVSKIYAFLLKPPSHSVKSLLLNVFKPRVWISFSVVWMLLYAFIRGVSFYLDSKYLQGTESDVAVGSHAFLWVIGTFSQQGSHVSPKLAPLRIVFIIGYLTGLICFVAYSASLISILSVEEEIIKSYDDVLQYGYQVFFDQDVPSGLSFNKTPRSSNSILDPKVAFQKMYFENAAFLSFPDLFYQQLGKYLWRASRRNTVIQSLVCKDIIQVPVSPRIVPAAMTLRKRSFIQPLFNPKIMFIMERGIKYRYLTNSNRENVIICEKIGTPSKPISLQDVSTAFFVLSLSFILALLFLIGEKLYNYLCARSTVP